MRYRTDWIDTGGGHIVVAIFIFLVGVALSACGIPEGKEVTVGALASLWTSLRVQRKEQAKE